MGLFSSLFGGSSSSSKSENKAFQQIKDWATPLMAYAGQGAGGMSSLLGGDTGGFDAFKSGVGYDWNLGQGTNDILAQRAAVGGLDSGATLKGLAKYQTGLNNQYLDQYFGGLNSLIGSGNTAAGTLTNVGQVNTSKSKSGGGLGGILGGAIGTIATGGF